LKNDLEFYKAVAKQRNEDVAFYRSKKIEIENELRRVRVDDVDRLAREVSDLRSTLDSAYAEIFELRALNDTQADTIEDLKELVDTIEDDLKNAKDDLSYFEGRVIRCPTCSGRGKVTRPEPTQCPGGEGFAPQLWQCPACSGRGKIAINDGKIEGYNG
jgi:hypothetical protein